MDCNFSNQLMIAIENNGKTLDFTHCCVLYDEIIQKSSIQELLDSKDVFSYLNSIFQQNPKNHNFFPQNSDCMGATICDFSKRNLNFLTISTQACNLNCNMCVVDRVKTPEDFQESKNAYFQILEKIKNLKLQHLQLSSSGEPFLHKRMLIDWICSIQENTIENIGFVTNATLLNKEDIAKMCNSTKSKNIGLTSIVSCDGITSETYKKIRNIDAFNRVVDNILEFKKYNKLYCVNFVITPDNIHELKDVPEFWLSKGITPRIIYPICHPEWDWMREDQRVKFIQENYSQYYVNN